ncbi:phage tail tape measure protein [Pediococcus inopinatus]|uniref:phage tail tape measure protein n=1 Tax=Pediococcus inopinatus TaxID=114090 RepID=UPI002A6A7BC5|nr:phage tail tape measure protein [Pediococcus inopinatus]WPP08518.1 phage tail tape measure protein [Pediococcus inopinatus]
MGETAGLNFDVFLNDHGMQKSMKELKSTASMLKSEMRSNFAELKSGGQVTDAYADKVKKSGEAIKAEQNVIDSAEKAQKGLDLQTEEGRKEYAKQEIAISGAKKSIVSLTGEQNRAKESLNYYKSGMADMNKSMKNASNSSKAYVDRLRAEGKENQANKAQLTGLSEKYSSLSGIYKKQEEELNKISKSSGIASEAYLKQKTRLDQTGKAMAEVQIRTKSLNKSTGGLSTTMSRIADKGASLSKSLNNAGNKAIAFGKTSSTASLAVGAGFIYGSKKAIELQNSFKQTTNLIKNGGETQKAAISGVNKMQNDAAADAVKYGKSQKSIADGYQDLVKRGYSSKQALGAMRSELQASVASGDDFKDVVTVASQTLEAFGLRTNSTAGMISNTKKVTNQLAYAADLTSTGFSDLGVGMSYVGSTAHQAGFSLSETAAAMGLLSNNGLEADKAGTGLRKAINSLISPTKGGISALKTMNLSTKDFIDKKGNMKSMTDIFGLLKSHTDGMSKTEKTNLFHSLFGTTGQQAGLILAASSKQLGKLNDQVARSDKQHNGQGYVATLANQNMKTAQNQLAKFKQAGEAVSIMFAKNVLPYITKIAVKLAGILDRIGKMSPKTQKLTVGFGLVLAAISPVAFAIGGISKGIGASITGLKNMAKWYGKLNSKMAAPVTSRAISNGKGISNQWNSLNTGGKLATGAAGAGVAISSGLDIYGAFKAKNPDKKFKDAGKGIGTALGGGIGLFFGGPLGAALGATIGKVIGGWGGKGAQLFTDGWNKKGKNGKPPKGFLPKAGYYARSGADAIASWTKSFTKGFGKAIKSIASFNKSVGKVFGKAIKSIASFNKSVGKVFGKVVSIIKSVLKPIGRVLELAIVIPIALVVGLAIKAWQKIRKPFKAVLNYISKAIKLAWKGIKSISKSTWNAVKKYVINPVKTVWNAVNKYIVKKIVKGIKNAWKDVKSVTRSAWNLFKKYVINPVKTVWNAVNKYIVKKIVKGIKNAWGDIKSLTKAAWNLVKKYAVDPIVSVYNKVSSIMGKLKKVISSSMSSIKNVWHSAWKNVGDFFGDIWKSIKKHAQDGINGVIKVINTGISGIDGVIHAFGGKKHAISRIGKVHFATGTGSLTSSFRRSIDRMTPAVVNDRPGASNPELIYRHATGNVEWMKGRNAETMLMPGDEVANDHDSALLAPALGIKHFAKGGIGNIFGGIGSFMKGAISGAVSTVSKGAKWLKNLFTTATKIIAHPIKSVESLFKYSKNGTKGIFTSIGKGAFDKTAKNVKNWWGDLWSMVNLNGDSAGGNWAHNPGLSETNGFGASRLFGTHDGVDFSGKLGSAITAVHGGTVTHIGKPLHGWPYSQLGDVITVKSSDGYQEIYQEFGDMGNIKVSTGDEIKTGQKIATLGRLNGAGSGAHVHIGVSKGSLWDHGGGSTKGWYDVTKMHGGSDGSSKSKKSSSVLDKLVKSEVGSGFFKLIKKIANKFGDAAGGSMGNPSGSSVTRWKPYVIKALKANGFKATASQVAAWMRVISRESGGNPKAINNWDSNARAGHPSKGLVQTIEQTFNGNKFKGHDHIYNGYDDLLAGIRYMKRAYGSGASAFARVSGSKGYANGGFSSTAKLANISEGNSLESIIPLSKPSRAWELIGKSSAYLNKKNNSHTPSANTSEDNSEYLQQLIDQNSQLLNQIGQFMQLVQAKPTGITAQQVYAANKQQTAIQTTKYNRSLGLS